MELEKKLEAILFWKGEPMSLSELGKILKVSPGDLIAGVNNLKESLAERGIVLQEKDNPARNASSIAGAGGEITLGTAPELSSLIENLQKEELNKDLSKASLETLSIILYKNGASRAEIDYIRGVNSSFILRALAVRGLVEKVPDPADNRRFLYQPTFDLLSFMGVKSVAELPEYGEISEKLKNAQQQSE